METSTAARASAAGSRPRPSLAPGSRGGFTLIEILIVISMIATLATLAFPAVHHLRERALFAKAVGDIKAIEFDVLGYEATQQTTPPSLNAVGRGSLLDPWGNPYRYLSFAHARGGAAGPPPGARKDKFLQPINTTFDLYSMGPDGQSQLALTARTSHDDIVRANDGGFIGWGRNY